jgi:hypothetical protein
VVELRQEYNPGYSYLVAVTPPYTGAPSGHAVYDRVHVDLDSGARHIFTIALNLSSLQRRRDLPALRLPPTTVEEKSFNDIVEAASPTPSTCRTQSATLHERRCKPHTQERGYPCVSTHSATAASGEQLTAPEY